MLSEYYLLLLVLLDYYHYYTVTESLLGQMLTVYNEEL